MKRTIDASLSYAKTRKQFGKTIAEHQGIQWLLADMASEIDAARLLTQRAAWMKTQGIRFTKEASIAKLLSSRAAVKCADRAIQIHGGYGYITEYPVEKFFRDAKICEIGEGTSEMQRIIIARELLKKT